MDLNGLADEYQLTTRLEIREGPGCSIWEVSDEEGRIFFDVKCGVHRIVRFDNEVAANAHFDRWAPEVANDIAIFD